MNSGWMTGLAVTVVLAGTGVLAQEAPPPPPGAVEKTTTTTTTTTWTVRPEDRTVIHDYVVREKPVPQPIQEKIVVGDPVPDAVELHPVPDEIVARVPSAGRYEYFDWEGRMVFVDPDTRRVVQIVD